MPPGRQLAVVLRPRARHDDAVAALVLTFAHVRARPGQSSWSTSWPMPASISSSSSDGSSAVSPRATRV